MPILSFLNQHKKTIGFLVLIFVLCLIPTATVSGKLGWTIYLGIDKWVHAFLFFMWFYIWSHETKLFNQWVVYFVICATIIGAGIEVLQYILPVHRSAELADFFADLAGLFIGYFVVKETEGK